VITTHGKYLFIQVPPTAWDFRVDHAMQFFVYKVPNKNFSELDSDDPFEWGIQPQAGDTYKMGGCKLPEGQFETVGKLFRLDKEAVNKIGFRTLMQIAKGLNAKETFILFKRL
jgi:hypothetical protein